MEIKIYKCDRCNKEIKQSKLGEYFSLLFGIWNVNYEFDKGNEFLFCHICSKKFKQWLLNEK